MLFELRTYQAGGGRMAEMENLMARDCTPVLQRARVPRPLGAWRAIAGPRLPAFIWILGWESLDQRNAAWSAFGADAQWQQLRRAAHEETELTVRVDTQFMTAWPEAVLANGADLSPTGAVCQLLMHRFKTGMGGAARQAFLQHDQPVLEESGGRIDAGFDLQSGEDLPMAAIVVRWPDVATCASAMAAYDSHPKIRAARAGERSRHGFDLFASVDRYVLASSPPFGQ